MQTLATAVKQLTQCNQELEQQLNQRDEQHPNDQHNKRDNDESNNNHLPTRDRQEREDQEESNTASRQDRQEDTNCPSKLESGAICVAQEMQMMKEKIDMMMNAMSGWVSTNLDEPQHRTNSPFTA